MVFVFGQGHVSFFFVQNEIKLYTKRFAEMLASN